MLRKVRAASAPEAAALAAANTVLQKGKDRARCGDRTCVRRAERMRIVWPDPSHRELQGLPFHCQ